MQPAQHATLRPGMVVLHELLDDPGVVKTAPVVRLDKETAFVAVVLGLHHDETLEPGRAEGELQ